MLNQELPDGSYVRTYVVNVDLTPAGALFALGAYVITKTRTLKTSDGGSILAPSFGAVISIREVYSAQLNEIRFFYNLVGYGFFVFSEEDLQLVEVL